MVSTSKKTRDGELRSAFLITRAQLLWRLRSFFHDEGFLEIETPSIVCSPGLEPQLDAFEVNAQYAYHNVSSAAHERRRLHTSPEYALKRYLGDEGRGVNRVYSIGSCFRDEVPSRSHSPEFTMLEWYARDLTLEDLMSQCESLVISLAGEAARRHQLSPGGVMSSMRQQEGAAYLSASVFERPSRDMHKSILTNAMKHNPSVRQRGGWIRRALSMESGMRSIFRSLWILWSRDLVALSPHFYMSFRLRKRPSQNLIPMTLVGRDVLSSSRMAWNWLMLLMNSAIL